MLEIFPLIQSVAVTLLSTCYGQFALNSETPGLFNVDGRTVEGIVDRENLFRNLDAGFGVVTKPFNTVYARFKRFKPAPGLLDPFTRFTCFPPNVAYDFDNFPYR